MIQKKSFEEFTAVEAEVEGVEPEPGGPEKQVHPVKQNVKERAVGAVPADIVVDDPDRPLEGGEFPPGVEVIEQRPPVAPGRRGEIGQKYREQQTEEEEKPDPAGPAPPARLLTIRHLPSGRARLFEEGQFRYRIKVTALVTGGDK